MAIELRDIVSDADREAALSLRVRPDQERFVASVEDSFLDAVRHPEALAKYWAAYDGGQIVGFAMISDGIPADVLEADPTLIGPYYLWRLLIDAAKQREGYGTAILDAIVAYVRSRGGDALFVSYQPGDGGPGPFYERYGFVPTGRVVDGEPLLRLELDPPEG